MVIATKDGRTIKIPTISYEVDYKNYGWKLVEDKKAKEEKVDVQEKNVAEVIEEKVDNPVKEKPKATSKTKASKPRVKSKKD